LLGSLFTDSPKPYEVEIVVAQVSKTPADDEIYRITFDGAVADEHDFVVIGGQADRVAAVIKEQYSVPMSLAEAMRVAIASLAGQGDAAAEPLTSGELEVALLERDRAHRAFRRIVAARLDGLLAEARAEGEASGAEAPASPEEPPASPEGSA
jgi:proteasome alpha subunit